MAKKAKPLRARSEILMDIRALAAMIGSVNRRERIGKLQRGDKTRRRADQKEMRSLKRELAVRDKRHPPYWAEDDD
jgi:hypothetical protein